MNITEGKLLPLTRREMVHKNGSLIVDNVQKASDGGTYSCTASTRHGQTSSQPVVVKVLGMLNILILGNHDMCLEKFVFILIKSKQRLLFFNRRKIS